MYYDKGKYESLIMNSPLFDIDKEQETTAYKRESYKMAEYLYCYLLAINERDYEPYGSEIMDVATRCINNFDSSKASSFSILIPHGNKSILTYWEKRLVTNGSMVLG